MQEDWTTVSLLLRHAIPGGENNKDESILRRLPLPPSQVPDFFRDPTPPAKVSADIEKVIRIFYLVWSVLIDPPICGIDWLQQNSRCYDPDARSCKRMSCKNHRRRRRRTSSCICRTVHGNWCRLAGQYGISYSAADSAIYTD
jgi:hypothetical protein